MAIKAILFDLDGTLWDSYPLYSRLLAERTNRTVEELFSDLSHNVSVARLFRRSGLNSSNLLSNHLEAYDYNEFLYPGALATLKGINGLAVPVGVVTSLPGWIAKPMLKWSRLTDYFSTLIDFGSTSKHKPNPEPIHAALEGLGVSPSEGVYYVGDTAGDFRSAYSAGISFVFASYGYGKVGREFQGATLADLSPAMLGILEKSNGDHAS